MPITLPESASAFTISLRSRYLCLGTQSVQLLWASFHKAKTVSGRFSFENELIAQGKLTPLEKVLRLRVSTYDLSAPYSCFPHRKTACRAALHSRVFHRLQEFHAAFAALQSFRSAAAEIVFKESLSEAVSFT